jgi:sugar lactone lactonase YvrE
MKVKRLFRDTCSISLTAFAATFMTWSSRADNIFVSNGGNNTVAEFTSSGGAGTTFASTGLNVPDGLAFDASGNLYVGNYAGNTIDKFTPGGVGSVFASSGLNAPYSMAFDPSGNLYVANAGSSPGYIEKYTPAGVGSVFASGVNYPIGLTFGPNGNLFGVSMFANSIIQYNSAGVGSVFTSTGLNLPQQLVFDKAGNLYVSNKGDSQPGSGYIEKYTPGGVGSVFASGLYFPDGLAFDSAGDLLVNSRGASDNLIYDFAPNGTETTFTTDVSMPESIAIQATPEPGTWALLGLGAGIFLCFRRRQLATAK